jgi:hypothetical protein
MGNTGSFMLRQGNFKLITFGKHGGNFNGSCGAPCTYNSQLFDVENDPEELHDVAALVENQLILASMDQTLRSIIPYDDVDLFAKAEDHDIYDKFYLHKFSTAQLKKKWAGNYGGNKEPLTDAQWEKILQWTAEGRDLRALRDRARAK